MLAALGDEVVPVEVDGVSAWMLRDHATEAAAAEPVKVARLLPGFDMWQIGASRDAAALLDPAEKKRVYRNQGWISPVLLVNGRMDGVWSHERKGKRLTVTIEPFGRVPKWARTQAEAEAERLAAYLGGDLSVSWAGRDRPAEPLDVEAGEVLHRATAARDQDHVDERVSSSTARGHR